MKVCTKCKIEKPLSEFYKSKEAADGRQSECKSCSKERQKEYRQRPEVKEYQEEYRQIPEVKERIKEYQEEYRQRPEVKERKKEYKQRPEVKLKGTLSNGLRRSIKNKNGSSTFELLNYTYEEFADHLTAQFVSDMSLENHGIWHIHHIIPLDYFKCESKFDPNFRLAWSIKNLMPLSAYENLSLGNKLPSAELLAKEHPAIKERLEAQFDLVGQWDHEDILREIKKHEGLL